MDFETTVVSVDKESGLGEIRARPHPRRYELVDHDGAPHYLDKYLHTLISVDVMASAMANSLQGLPFFSSPRTVESASEYAAKRRPAVDLELATGEYTAPSETAKPHVPMEASDQREVVFLSLDVCGSTPYRQRDPTGFDRALKVMLQELGTTVGQFHGTILKTTGDGFIAFIDYPSFTVQCDAAVDLGTTLLALLRETVNPALVAANLAPLQIRIGADYGPAIMHRIQIATTGFAQLDVTSDALNRAVKIEQSCAPDTLRIGFDLYQLLHVQWLERATLVSFDGESVGVDGYQVFEVA